jgi:hypothetical protein
MKFVHHNTGEWHRPNDWSAVRRYPSDAYVQEYVQLNDINNEWLRSTFQWMLAEGLVVAQCGSDVFQIRGN